VLDPFLLCHPSSMPMPSVVATNQHAVKAAVKKRFPSIGTEERFQPCVEAHVFNTWLSTHG
jgi:hypothetical protein